MLFSYNWLKEYVKGLPSAEKLAEVLTMRVFEVEEIKKVGSDYYLDIDVLANRGADCFSHIGIAREAAAILKKDYKLVEIQLKQEEEKAKDSLSVAVENKKDCLRYTARVLKDVKVGTSPKWIQQKLKVCGLRPINNIVDITNYVMLESGQPLHAFDLDKIQGKKIIVRRAKKGEKIITLDGEKRKLDKDNLVIADTSSPLAIAGIKGGNKAEITKKTKRIVLESANFDSYVIRRSSQNINLRTDASLRFEHKIDPGLTQAAIDRAADLISQNTKAKVLSGLIDINFTKPRIKKIKLDLNYIEKLLGVKTSKKEVKDILQRLEFKVVEARPRPQGRGRASGQLDVEVPSFRLDINLPEDLIEEIGRIKGYENIPSVFPITYLSPPKKNFNIFWQNTAKDILKELGFIESYNYSFISEKDLDIFELNNLIELENPISSDFKYLRPSLIPNLLKNINKNIRNLPVRQAGFKNIKIFELGKIFAKTEKNMLLGLSTGSFYQIKGTVDSLLQKLGISNIYYDDFQASPEDSSISIWQKGKTAEIKIDNKEVGFLGEISSNVLKKMNIAEKIVCFDIDFDKLQKLASEEREYEPVSQYPAAVRDIAVLVPFDVKVIDVMNIISTAGGDLVVDIDLFDIYEGENLPEGKKNFAFHIVYQAKNRTLKAEQIDELQNKIIKALEKNPEWEVRK